MFDADHMTPPLFDADHMTPPRCCGASYHALDHDIRRSRVEKVDSRGPISKSNWEETLRDPFKHYSGSERASYSHDIKTRWLKVKKLDSIQRIPESTERSLNKIHTHTILRITSEYKSFFPSKDQHIRRQKVKKLVSRRRIFHNQARNSLMACIYTLLAVSYQSIDPSNRRKIRINGAKKAKTTSHVGWFWHH